MAAMAICERKKIVGERKRRKAACAHLPEEIIRDILLRVSAKDIISFQTVCKPWYSLVCHSSFTRTHFARTESCEDEEIIFTTINKPTDSSHEYQYDNFSLDLQNLKSPPTNTIFHNKLKKTLVLQSSCKGLLLFQDKYSPDQLYISNPLLAHCYPLRPTPSYACEWALVYDVYKVVGFFINSLYVFTFAKGWQNHTNVRKSDYRCELMLSQYVCVGREMHWLSIDRDDSSGKICFYIFSMHISEETFSKTRVPECGAHLGNYKIDLLTRNGLHLLTDVAGFLCLTIVSYDQLHVFLLHDKTESRWTPSYRIRLPSLRKYPSLNHLNNFLYDDICIFAIGSDLKDNIRDIFKILIHQDDHLYYYDLKTKELKLISYLSKHQKLCRSYMFHSNKLAFPR